MIAATSMAAERRVRISLVPALLAVAAAFACSRPPSRVVEEAPPNVLVVLGDTVRQDAVGCYGAGAGRTPAIDALAASGVRFAQARASSSWTLPSVASAFTSRWPHEVTDWGDLEQRLPDEAETVAELFQRAGYDTAGFVANVLVNPDDGFAQGFSTFWVPPLDASMWTDALTTADRAAGWLATHQQHPFFAYVHFVDPHSPYCPPARRPRDRTAPIPGDVNPSFFGRRPLPDAATLAEWRSLYAEEVALVDQGLARVLGALAPEVRRRTLVVFLADHGEDFMDHGFLGHGWSLYDELVKVPLVISGPDLPAGRVVSEPVGLVDLLPTLTHLAGLERTPAARAWRGIDLSRAFRGEPLPRERTFLAETYRYGPLRLAVMRGATKAIFFNAAPGEPPPVTDRLFGEARVRALLPREALFDLQRDPREQANLAADPAARSALLEARQAVFESLRRVLPGRWIGVRGPGRGGRIEGVVRYRGRPERIVPLFLRDGESLTVNGDEVRVSLEDDGTPRAWLVPDRADLGVAAVEVTAAGTPLLARESVDGLASGAGWASWTVVAPRPASAPGAADEQVRRLKALGYLQ
jgi:arylsulfatase A-like enzyme